MLIEFNNPHMKISHNRNYRDLVVISDLHLGSYHCLKQELLEYLNSINPGKLVLLGSIVEEAYWQTIQGDIIYSRIFAKLREWVANGTQLYFISKTNPEIFASLLQLDKSKFVCKSRLEFRIDQKNFLLTSHEHISASKFKEKHTSGTNNPIRKLAGRLLSPLRSILYGKSYDVGKLLAVSSGKFNFLNHYFQRIEEKIIDYASSHGFAGVITGQMQAPKIINHKIKNAQISFINTGVWNSSLSALEYQNGKWELHMHEENFFAFKLPRLAVN